MTEQNQSEEESWQEYLKMIVDSDLFGTGIIKKEITSDGQIKTIHIPLQEFFATDNERKETK